jgi:hypothetical protein
VEYGAIPRRFYVPPDPGGIYFSKVPIRKLREKVVFDAIRELMTPPKPPAGQRKKIGFQLKETKTAYGKK